MAMNDLIVRWKARASEYLVREREATAREQHVIAAQQAGLSIAFRICAKELEREVGATK